MAKIINCKEIRDRLYEDIKQRPKPAHSSPKLVVISVGDDAASKVYIRNKEKACNELGFDFLHKHHEFVTTTELIKEITALNNDAISVQRINELNSVLHPTFTLAVRDDLIRSAPTSGIMSEIKSYSNSARNQKQALTETQQEKFINFCYTQPKLAFWAPLFVFLLGTGCRISEASGLTWDDCDFEKGVIYIRRGLTYADHGDGYKFHISTTKTNSGTRTIPMLSGVRQALEQVKFRQEKFGFESFTIGGISNFVFTSPKSRPILNNNMFNVLDNALIEYNRIEGILSEREDREPDFMPHITPHIFRHTFCSRLFEAGVNVKVIQEIMGHSSAVTTLDIYTHTSTEKKIQSLSKLDAKLTNVV